MTTNRCKILFSGLLTMCVFSVVPTLVLAQDAVPGEILGRTLFIKSGEEAGTAFKVDYKSKVYLVTARHVVAALPLKGGMIQVKQQREWKDFKIVKKILPSSDEVDIAVLQTEETVSKPYEITWSDKDSVTFGQQIWFLGYPYGLGTQFSNAEIPFIKRGTLSAIDTSNRDAVLWYIDGFNNPGFSGGPIIYWDFNKHAIRILGVVKGYKFENAKVLVNGVEQDTNLLVNSGILVGYSIKHAFDAIEKANSMN
jgi:S1-C subfamily serine protease